ncbi:MAG: hypothetical protein ABI678_07125 [Kofleriaceae bacterium]
MQMIGCGRERIGTVDDDVVTGELTGVDPRDIELDVTAARTGHHDVVAARVEGLDDTTAEETSASEH